MGHKVSLLRHNFQQHTLQTGRSPSASLFDFTAIWLGGNPIVSDATTPLPETWDELLDWTEDAQVITAVACEQNGTSSILGSHTLPPESKGVQFIPYVLRDHKDRIEGLSSLSWIERARFFSESVVVTLEIGECTEKSDAKLLSLIQFCKYHMLVRRLADLLVLAKLGNPEADNNNNNNNTSHENAIIPECLICCSEKGNAILPCHHTICETCEQKWVRKRLLCPFCRQRFSNVNELKRTGWHISEFSEMELAQDIADLEQQIQQFWKEQKPPPLGEGHVTLNDAYVQVERQLAVSQEEDDDFLVLQAKRTDSKIQAGKSEEDSSNGE